MSSSSDNVVEKPVFRSDPQTEPVANQPDIITKSEISVDSSAATPPKSNSISESDIKEAERLAEASKRDPVPASFIGWKQIGGYEEKDALTHEDELLDVYTPTLLDSYLPDKFYGDWYHNIISLIIAALLSWLIGFFRFSLAPVFFVMLVFGVYYRTSIRKYRSVIRDDIQKEFTIKHIENNYETMDWLNTFLDKFWIYLEPSISQIVTEQVNPILASNESIPAFVKAIWIDEFTAGVKPPRVDFVKTLGVPIDDVVVMDWAFSFTPHSVADLSPKHLKSYVNQKIVVKAKLFGITLPVIVEDVSFSVWARVRLKMTSSFPHIETINVSVMEPPEFDFVSRLLGESVFNWEILALPGLFPLLNQLVLKFAGPLLFKPFSFQLNVPQLLSGANTSIGILSIKAKSAKGLKAADRILGNTIDPYLTFGYSGSDILAKTKIILDTLTPTWNETIHVLVKDFTAPLVVTAYDFNEDRKDKRLGQLQIDLNTVSETKQGPNQIGKFLRNSKQVGTLSFDYEFFPTLEPTNLIDGSVEPPKDLNTGLVKIDLKELRNVKTLDGSKLSQYTEVYFNNELIKKSSIIKGNETPSFSIPFETIVTDRRKAKVKVLVKDPKGKIIGASRQSLNSLIDRTEVDREWISFAKGEGEFKLSTIWKSVELKNVAGVGSYTEPIGVVRVLLQKAEGVHNLEAVGKVDPYARVLVNNVVKGRTDFIDGTLDPVWNESIYVSVTSPNQKITIEVLDAERNHKDRTLGSFDIKTSNIIEKSETGDKYLEYVDKKLRSGKLVHKKKGPKGIVTYALSFYPTLPVKSLEDIEDDLKEKQKREKEAEQEAKEKSKDPKKSEKSSEEAEAEDFESTDKIELSLPELVEYHTGFFVFTIIAGEYSNTDTYLQAFFDNHGYSDFSIPIKNKTVTVPHTSDALIKELEWSNVTFRIVKKDYSTRIEEFIAESTIPTLSLLNNSYHEGKILTLNGIGSNKIKIQSRWIPVIPSALPPSDLITNSGDLDLDIISASNLSSADSNGKSDPFVKVYIKGEEDSFYKTKTIKKTLNPVWNEKTSVQVDNRVNSILRFKILDWDFAATQDDRLGEAYLDLADIDPFNSSEYTLKIEPPKDQEASVDAGEIKVKVSFRPRYIIKAHTQTMNFGDTGLKAVGTGIGTGIGVGKNVIGSGVGVVGKVKKTIFGGKKENHVEN